ncbi:MAG: hypothetical protein WAZ18_04120 [Alphaproteobacteria bacterium]
MMRYAPTLALLMMAGTAHAAYEDAVQERPCLDYWAVGNTKGCAKPENKKKPPPVASTPSPTAPPPVAASTPPSNTLDGKIDKFLADHGKPPREFVAFYLDPTPEHAVQWVAKYNELLQRGQDIAVAWTQAETLYNNAIKQGTPATALNPNPFPVVPDFGIPVPGFNTPAFTQLISSTKPIVPAQLTGVPDTPLGYMAPLPPPPEGEEGLLKPTLPTDAPYTGKLLEVSYYFSAVCPYCKKFEPDFAEVIRQMGNGLSVTCVDVTPESAGIPPNPSNVHNLPCTWREPEGDELTRLGVKQTPSLVINKGSNQPLELISGYVEPSKLISYFKNILQSALAITGGIK